MREIKFDYVVRNIKFDEIHHHVFTLEQVEKHTEMYTYMFSPNGQILARRQYTGLKDKNGVEIYEEDIVKLPDFNATVRFYKGAFLFNPQDGSHLNSLINDWRQSEIEVIGNIYENPELLKENKQ